MQLNTDSCVLNAAASNLHWRSRGCLSPFSPPAVTRVLSGRSSSLSFPSPTPSSLHLVEHALFLCGPQPPCSLLSLVTLQCSSIPIMTDCGGSSPPRRATASRPGVTMCQKTSSLQPQLNSVMLAFHIQHMAAKANLYWSYLFYFLL